MGETTYADLRTRLEEALAALAGAAQERGSPAAEAARALAKKAAEGRFEVAVLGDFNRGKTTFVNALLGAEVLPSGVLPLTSVVTAVTWGSRPRAEVRYRDGRTEDTPLESLSKFVTESGNPGNRLGVERVLVAWPADDLRDGTFLWDTPGVGSVHRHNTEVAKAVLPHADAAIFLVSADPPVSEAERSFLLEASRVVPRIFVVLNKVDTLGEREREEVLSFTRAVVSQALDAAVPLHALSARQALQARLAGDGRALEASGFAAFRHELRTFLLAHRGHALLVSLAAQARRVVRDELNSLRVEEFGLSLPAEEFRRRAEAMEQLLRQVSRAREDLQVLLDRETRRLVDLLDEDLRALAARARPALLAEAERFLHDHPDPARARAELRELVRERLRAMLEDWRRREERRVGEASRASAARFVEEANALLERTVALCAGVLQADLGTVATPPPLPEGSRFTYAFFEPPSILESVLPDVGRFLPRAVARRRLLQAAREEVPLLVDKHAGRLRWDFVQRVEAGARSLLRDVDDRLRGALEGLRLGAQRALDERARAEGSAASAAERLARARARLEAVDLALREVLRAAGELATGGGRP